MKSPLFNFSGNSYKPFFYGLILFLIPVIPTAAQVWTYNLPGGEQFSSPDYNVTIEQGTNQFPSFVHYSYGLDEYLKLSVGIQNYKGRRTIESHSTAIFSFSGTIRVYVTIKKNAKHITLPLKSAKILPSSYNIPCQIINDSTITFTLDRPEKVVVMANYEEASGVFSRLGEGHVPIQNWNSNYTVESKKPTFKGNNVLNLLSESYKNPIFIIALPPEENIPDKNSPNTLVVNPGDHITQEQLYPYDAIWFAPGIHDLSRIGETKYFQIGIKSGQTLYLEGGSYVMAHFIRNKTIGSGSVSVKGRGMLSGMKHVWGGGFELGSILVDIDTITGVSFTDRNNFSIHGGRHIKDVSLLGAWHGNNDGPDYIDNCLMENCFLMAHDDNLKLNKNTHARHIVIWQSANAHPIMVKEIRNNVTFADCIVEDIDIVGYFHPPTQGSLWKQLSMGTIASVTGSNMNINNFIYRNIRIESPFLFRVFTFFNMDTSQPYTADWFTFKTTEEKHTRINGIVFENISVNSPVILYRSLLGSAYDNSLSNLSFKNLVINGTQVTNLNKDEFFEIEYDKVDGLDFQGEKVDVDNKPELNLFSIYPNPANQCLTLISTKAINDTQAYMLHDLTGRLIETKAICENETIIKTDQLAAGTYILKITGNNRRLMSFKILKN